MLKKIIQMKMEKNVSDMAGSTLGDSVMLPVIKILILVDSINLQSVKFSINKNLDILWNFLVEMTDKHIMKQFFDKLDKKKSRHDNVLCK